MIIYEVNLDVENEVAAQYLGWLQGHVDRMLKHRGFTKAQTYHVESENLHMVSICIHYYLETREALEDYLKNHAPEMRKEASDLFGSKFKAHRRILRVTKERD